MGYPRLVVDGLADRASEILPQLAAAENDLRLLQRGDLLSPLAHHDDGLESNRLVTNGKNEVGCVAGRHHSAEARVVVTHAQCLQDVVPNRKRGKQKIAIGITVVSAVESLNEHDGPSHRFAGLRIHDMPGEGTLPGSRVTGMDRQSGAGDKHCDGGDQPPSQYTCHSLPSSPS